MDNVALSKIVPLNNLTTSKANFCKTLRVMADARFVTTEVMNTLKEKVRQYMEAHPRAFTSTFYLSIREFQPPYQCWITIYVEHPYPVHPVLRWRQDQSALLTYVLEVLRSNGVEYFSSGLPTAMTLEG